MEYSGASNTIDVFGNYLFYSKAYALFGTPENLRYIPIRVVYSVIITWRMYKYF